MTQQENISKVYSCSQCSKIFATRSNLKRHMENPNIHNIPYIRSRDQKRWKGHAKKIISKEETTERMRKWRAENREKNRQNDLRCRVYRLSRQKFGDQDTLEKQRFIRDEINRRLGRQIKSSSPSPSPSPSPPSSVQLSIIHPRGRRYKYQSSFMHQDNSNDYDDEQEDHLTWKSPFYHLPHQKIQLPSIDTLCPPLISSTNLRRRTSSSSESSISTITTDDASELILPPVHTFLYPYSEHQHPLAIKNEHNSTKILDEFVGVVLDYAQSTDNGHHHHHHHHSRH